MQSAVAILLLLAALYGGPAGEPAGAVARQRSVCDRYAAPSGHDRWPGSRRRPVRSLPALVRRLRPGQAGCLRGGRYGNRRTEADLWRRRGSGRGRVVVRPAPGERATVVGLVVIKGDGITLDGLTIDGDNALAPGSLAQPLIVDGSHDAVLHSDYTNHRHGNGFLLRRGTGAVIRWNRIHGVGGRFGYTHGIYVARARSFTIADNWIYDCPDGWGIHLFPDADGGVIVRNVIDGCGSGVVFSGEGDEASDGNLFARNVVVGSTGLGRFNSGTAVAGFRDRAVPQRNLVVGNVFYGNRAGSFDTGRNVEYVARGNKVAAPPFVNAARHDYRLRAGRVAALLGLGGP